MEQAQLKKMVDEDIVYCTAQLKAYSQDRELMEALFNTILFRYIELIENFAQGLKIISPYDKSVQKAVAFSTNVTLLVQRLKMFRDNNYSNEGLLEKYWSKEISYPNNWKLLTVEFNEVRQQILALEKLTSREKDEIIDKIDAIEEICVKTESKKEKWNQLRPFVVWISGKELEVAMRILPLFQKI